MYHTIWLNYDPIIINTRPLKLILSFSLTPVSGPETKGPQPMRERACVRMFSQNVDVFEVRQWLKLWEFVILPQVTVELHVLL